MRVELALCVLLVAQAGLAGCLSDGDEEVDPTADANASPEDADGDASDAEVDGSDGSSGSGPNGTADGSPDNGTADSGDANETVEDQAVENPPTAVVAHIDTGVNPYHVAFRDRSQLAQTHPSEYIDGYPEDAKALNLTFDADSFAEALEADRDVWNNVSEDQLYWIPGTRIVGAISLGDGGSRGSATDDPVMTAEEIAQAVQDGNVTDLLTSHDTTILDNHGHGTMTASRAVGASTSLAPSARLVTIEGLGAESVRWAADAGFVDVQTNSWIDRVPPPANQAQDDVPQAGTPSTSEAFAYAADRMVTLAASGNGAAYQAGVAPTPTFTLATAPDGVILVGAHDNGYLAPWSGSPPHVVADGFRPMAAVFDSTTEVRPHAYSCCTSASAPYAAGGAAHAIVQARTLLDDTGLGVENGTVAEGSDGAVESGPLSDGEFTLDELREVFFHTAQQRPRATFHDGQTHWGAEPTSGGPDDPTEPGENAYCPGCWSTPVPYSEIPSEVPTYLYTGYGAINLFSDQVLVGVLSGLQEAPDRGQADTFYQADQDVREAYYPPTGP